MALLDTLKRFKELHPDLISVFYATTPPAPILSLLDRGRLRIGNLEIAVKPDVFICPPNILQNLVKKNVLKEHKPFMKNQGSVLLVKKGNPKKIYNLEDLSRDGITLFLSNPTNEKASYQIYVETIKGLGEEQDFDCTFLTKTSNIIYGNRIHHREAPKSISEGKADVAILFYHLALRYVRIFPDEFELIPLGGTVDEPDPSPANRISHTHYALINSGGIWGEPFAEFLESDNVTAIYEYHGMQRH